MHATTTVRWVVALALALGLVAGSGVVAEAQKVDKKVQLLPGGRTIGGPGSLTGIPPGGDASVFFVNVAVGACVTVANTGKDDATINNGGTSTTVEAGLTETICHNATTFVDLGCSAGAAKPCAFLWRVDAL